MAGTRCVMLLRAINVGRRQLPMAALREMAASFGWQDPKTHLASGNLVVTVKGPPAAAAKKLEADIATHFGFHTDVIVRGAAAFATYLADNPFAAASEKEPNRVMLLLANGSPLVDCEARLRERMHADESVRVVRDGLWIHYAGSIPASKLTPTYVDKCVGSPATGRNWRTVRALDDLLNPD
jgi:uncharacterized protein (DUF1697 family)